MPGKDVFLSYASEDSDTVKDLAAALENAGRTVFLDQKAIRPGADWRDVLEEEVLSCRSMIVVWSRASVKKRFVRDEAEEGLKRGVLLPIRIDESTVPLGFRGTKYHDLIGWTGESSAPAFRRLLEALDTVLGPLSSGPEPAGEHGTGAEQDRAGRNQPVARTEKDEKAHNSATYEALRRLQRKHGARSPGKTTENK